MIDVGRWALLIGFIVNVYALLAFVVGIRNGERKSIESGKWALMASLVMSSIGMAVLTYLLVTSDFSVRYVAAYTSSDLPLLYKVSALWAGQSGSLLLWFWTLSLFSVVTVFWPQRDAAGLIPHVGAVLAAIAIFFGYLLAFVTSPFEQLALPLREGQGLNPLLQNPGMVIHPTTTYLGYVGFSVPFAYAIAALINRKADAAWIRVTRRWTLAAWLFLSIGIIYGAQWAYVELGWGGYWAWDPVENASLMPWLTGTAFLHSVMIQEKKGMLKMWNIFLIIATFLLTIFGTFLTRSGILASVHAFGESSLGVYFLGFIALTLALVFWLVVSRKEVLAQENGFESTLSRESSFLVNNLLLVGGAFAVFWGTVFPLISEAVRGQKVTVGPPFFNQVMVPIGLATVVLMGICPLIAWKKSSLGNLKRNFFYPSVSALVFAITGYIAGLTSPGALVSFTVSFFVTATIFLEVYRGVRVRRRMTNEGTLVALYRLMARNRRRYGGYAVHLAVILMVVGITGSSAFHTEKAVSLNPGETVEIKDYALKYEALEWRREGRKEIVFADLIVSKDDETLGILRAEKVYHPGSDQPTTEVGILGGLQEDLYVILAGWEKNGKPASFKVIVNPLVAWLWLGEYLLIIGTVFAMWPERRALHSTAWVADRMPVTALAGRAER